MKKIDSQALDVLQKALGLSGRGSPVTELTDGVVDQVLDVGPIVRRSRTQAQSEGLYTGFIRNVHSAANSVDTGVSPFNAGTNALAPYPSPMPAGFDIWLLAAAVTQLSGSGTLSASLRVTAPDGVMGLSSVSLPTGTTMSVALWDSVATEGTTFGFKSGQTQPLQKIGMRLPRGATTQIIFASTSSAVATFDCFFTLGVFPVGLGQDVVV